MTVISIGRVRPPLSRALPLLNWQRVLSYLVVPLVLGWFAFALVDSVTNFAPQTIRLSADKDYDPYFDDFAVFYSAGHVARGDDADRLYDPSTLHLAEANELGVPADSIIRLPFYNPPGTVFPLLALSLLSLAGAAIAWTVLQLAFFSAAFVALARATVSRQNAPLLGIVILGTVSSMPFHETVLHGQMTMALLAGWVAIWFGAFRNRSDRWVVLGLTLVGMKPQLVVVPVVYLLLTRRWRAVGLATAVQALLGLAAVFFIDPMVQIRWVQLMIHATGWEDQNGIWLHAMFGWNAFVRALVGPEHHLIRTILAAVLTTGTAGYCVAAGRAAMRQQRYAELFSMLVFASILMSPHLFAQDLLLAAVPLAILSLTTAGRQRIFWLAFGGLGWALTFLHFDVLMGPPDEFAINLVSLWLAAGVLFAGFGAVRTLSKLGSPEITHAEGKATHSRLIPQLALAALVALILLVTVPGFAKRTLAESLQYSYSAQTGITYRILLPYLAGDGPN